MMHTYAGLGMIAILTAYSIDSYKQRLKPVIITLLPFLVAAIAIDCHLIDASVQSGLVGKQMAQEAVRKTGKPVDNVMVVIIEDEHNGRAYKGIDDTYHDEFQEGLIREKLYLTA